MKLSALVVLALAVFLPACNPKDGPEGSSVKDAEALVAKHDIDGAIGMLEGLRAKDENNATVCARLAELYTQKHDMPKAVILYKDLIRTHPEIGLVHVPLGQIYLDLRQFPEAKAEYETARKMGVGDDHVALPLGVCQGQLGDYEAADREFERALKAGQDEETVRYNQALLRSQNKQYKEAKALLEDIITKDPKNAGAKRELAHVLQVIDPSDSAAVKRSMDLLWEIKDELKDDPRMYEFMGDGWLIAGDYDACLQAYTEALRLGKNPKSVEDKYVLAKTRQLDAAKNNPAASKAPEKTAPKTTPKPK